jgi:hypothetical protein
MRLSSTRKKFRLKPGFFAALNSPTLTQAGQLSVALGIRPSELLNLTGPELFLFEVDYRLVSQALSESQSEPEDVKLAKMKEWKQRRLK